MDDCENNIHKPKGDGYCIICGDWVERVAPLPLASVARAHRPFPADIIGVPRDVQLETERNLLVIPTAIYTKRKLDCIFYCLYNAYKTCSRYRDKVQLARLVGLESPKNVTKILSTFQKRYPLNRAVMLTDPITVIRDFCRSLGIQEVELVVKRAEEYLKGNPRLFDEHPASVAAALLQAQKLNIPEGRLVQLAGRSILKL